MLAVFVLVFGGLYFYVSSMPIRYTSNAVVAFEPQPGRADGRDLISLLIQTYPQFVASQSAVDEAARQSGSTPAQVREGLEAEIPPLTLTMTISTSMADPAVAQKATQSLVDQVLVKGKEDAFLVATAISNADISDTPSGVSRKLLLAVSFILALGTALLAGLLAARIRWAWQHRATVDQDSTGQ